MGCKVMNAIEREDGVAVSLAADDVEFQSLIADLVVACDGPSSVLRSVVAPSAKRTYAGYVAWRGTVPESLLGSQEREAFVEKFTFFHAEGIQILAYLIPGKAGTCDTDERLLNWVWYCNYEDESSELEALLTDKEGDIHHWTMPSGKVRDGIWSKQKDYAEAVLPFQFAKLVRGTSEPFVQLVTDVVASQASHFGGKLLLAGDALAGFRPHTASSTNQAAYDALLLESLMSGDVTMHHWEQAVIQYAHTMQRHGVSIGDRSQFGHHPLAS